MEKHAAFYDLCLIFANGVLNAQLLQLSPTTVKNLALIALAADIIGSNTRLQELITSRGQTILDEKKLEPLVSRVLESKILSSGAYRNFQLLLQLGSVHFPEYPETYL